MENKEVVNKDWGLTNDKLNALSQAGIIPPKTPKSQVQVFAEVARRHGLDPFTKEIHLVKYGGTYATIIGIQGMRGRAADSNLHAGTEAPKFNLMPDGTYKTMAQLIKAGVAPETCSVTVYKIVGGVRVPFVATVAYKEFAKSGKWKEMPYNMIAKVAESHALRKAFPRHINGLYIDAEMQQAETIEAEVLEKTDEQIQIEKLSDQIRKELQNHDPSTAQVFRDQAVAKRQAGELDANYLQNVLEELKSAKDAA